MRSICEASGCLGVVRSAIIPLLHRRSAGVVLIHPEENQERIRVKYKSAIMTEASGSVGGLTASHNKGGAYFRARVTPVNPATPRQNYARAALSGAVSAWSNTLTAAEREAWSAYAEAVPVTNTIGSTTTLTGQQQFIGQYCARDQAGLAPVLTGPTVFDTGETITQITDAEGTGGNMIGLTATTMGLAFTFSNALSGGANILIYLGSPISQGREFFKGPYQWIGLPPLVAAAELSADFVPLLSTVDISPPLVVGQRRGLRARLSYSDGRLSTAYAAICAVIDNT
jgi:hypothetical protein